MNIIKKDNVHRTVRKRHKQHKKSLGVYFVVFVLFLVLFVSYLITVSIHPIGLIEYVKSEVASVGYGSGYDVSLNDGKPFYTLNSDDKFVVVSSNSVDGYNKEGKTIFEKKHSFSDPVFKLSETRFLIYGQGERTLSVNTFSKTLFSLNFSSGIITAALSDSGVFAVATKADGYSSVVSVFDKNNKKIYEWFSSEETVNSLSIADNGKSIAVSTLKVVNGKFVSNFYVLKFSSADAVVKKTFEDDVIYQIYPASTTTYCVVMSDNIEFINYKKDKSTSHKSEYSVSIIKQYENKIIAVRNIAANQEESVVEIYSNTGKLQHTFMVNCKITDFSYSANKIYLLGDQEISKYNTKGEIVSNAKANYDALYIEFVSSDTVACIRNSSIDKIQLQRTEE